MVKLPSLCKQITNKTTARWRRNITVAHSPLDERPITKFETKILLKQIISSKPRNTSN